MNYDGKKIVVGVSGGKDSTAVCLDLFEKGYSKSDFTRIFCNTGWEHKTTYEYLDELEKTIGPIIRLTPKIKVKDEHKEYIDYFETKLGFESPMIRRIFLYYTFPSRLVKYCTKEFKINPIKEYYDGLDCDYVNLVGIRKEESIRRSKMIEWEYNDFFDCWVHRPIIDWTEKQVINIHHRFNLIPNRLYLQNSNRVGCYPCINSNKRELKYLDDKRIDIIRELEQIINDLRKKEKEKDNFITFFQSKYRNISKIDDVIHWSKTSRGGKQLELFDTTEPTCVKWGMCNV